MTTELNTVALKLPTFWTTHPEVWFSQTEAQFAIRGITNDQTKYYYVISSLDQDTASRLLDIINYPPETDKYSSIKEKLLNAFGLSRREKAARLLDMSNPGDRKPSVILSEMRALASNHTNCMIFEEIFLRLLPNDIRVILSQEDFSNLDTLGLRADTLWLAKQQSLEINSLNKFRGRAQSNKDQISSTKTLKSNKLCFYHKKFGQNAIKCAQPCSFRKKMDVPTNISAVSTGTQRKHKLLFLKDQISSKRFLVDTGAEVSVLPVSQREKFVNTKGQPLLAANSSAIQTYGTRSLSLRFNSKPFKWNFVLADVPQPLLGADFLSANHLLVDLKSQRLIDTESFSSITCGKMSQKVAIPVSIFSTSNIFTNLLSTFPDITKLSFNLDKNKHGIEHYIVTTGPPVHAHPRRLSSDKLEIA